MSKEPTKPLKITMTLKDGRIASSDGIIMFDSILYHGWFAKHAPHVLRGEGCDGYDVKIGLPLHQLPGNRWAASKAVYDCIDCHIEYYNKRPDFFAPDKMKYLSKEKGIIDDSAGKFRAYRNPVVIRVAKNGELTFFCKGRADAIIDLLSYIPAAGKKPSMGWGIIDDIRIEEMGADYSAFHPQYGLMRPMPIEDAKAYPDFDFSKYPIMEYGVKPPYWKPCNATLCYVPIMK